MKKTKVVTVLIPAFNEEANIKSLLLDLLSQATTSFRLLKITVVSDGSTDQTVKLAREVKSKKIVVIDSKKRKGKNSRINEVFKKNKNSIVVVIDADTKITDKHFLDKLVSPIGEYDLTSSKVEAVTPKTNFEKILNVSIKSINDIFSKFNSGNNVYTCRGVARAFSEKLTKTLRFPDNAGDDAFSYFFCKANKFKYKFVKSAVCYIRLPNNLNDHIKQSSRFRSSQVTMQKLFKNLDIQEEYKLPMDLVINGLFTRLVAEPLLYISYILVNIYSKITSRNLTKSTTTWEIASSSKSLN